MKRKIRLTESELTRLIKRVISEQNTTKDVTVKVDCTNKTVNGFTGIANEFFTPHCATTQAGTTAKTEKLLPSGPGQMAFDNANAQALIDLGISKSSITWDVGNGYDIYIGNIEWGCINASKGIASLIDRPEFKKQWLANETTSKININSVVTVLQKQCQSFRNQRLSGKA